MAEIIIPAKGNRKSNASLQNKRNALRVDLTPMVDLGFLLITFFVFTTTMSTSKAMYLTIPDEKGTSMKTPESGALTILLNGNNQIHYYSGIVADDFSNVISSNYKEIRHVLSEKKKQTPAEKLMVIIVPGEESTYGNVVNILDELRINVIDRYALINNPQKEHIDIFKKF